jgi:hypothetical protein
MSQSEQEKLTIMLPTDLKVWAKTYAASQRITATRLITELIEAKKISVTQSATGAAE